MAQCYGYSVSEAQSISPIASARLWFAVSFGYRAIRPDVKAADYPIRDAIWL